LTSRDAARHFIPSCQRTSLPVSGETRIRSVSGSTRQTTVRLRDGFNGPTKKHTDRRLGRPLRTISDGRRVFDGRIEIDVVADVARQVHRRTRTRDQCRLDQRAFGRRSLASLARRPSPARSYATPTGADATLTQIRRSPDVRIAILLPSLAVTKSAAVERVPLMFDVIAARSSAASHPRLSVLPASRPQGVSPTAESPAEAHDAKLLEQVARWDDQAAFEELYRRHIDAVTLTAMHVCRNKHVTEEIAQHAFSALWLRAERLASKAVRLRPWLTTVARNAAIDHLRSASASVASLEEAKEQPSRMPEPECEALVRESSRELHAAVAGLSPEQQLAIELVYFAGMTYQAAADATGEPLGTIKSRVRLALGHLRSKLRHAHAG
jgi:RNA polymerase sigma factor (sigma-70 family)